MFVHLNTDAIFTEKYNFFSKIPEIDESFKNSNINEKKIVEQKNVIFDFRFVFIISRISFFVVD